MPELKVGTLNAGGLARNAYPALLATIGVDGAGLDVCFVCETWASPGSSAPSADFVCWSPFLSVDEDARRGCKGFGLWVREGFPREQVRLLGMQVGISIWFTIESTLFCGVYIPGNTPAAGVASLLAPPNNAPPWADIIIMGDMNARLGPAFTNDPVQNAQGRILIDHAMEHGLRHVANTSPTPTFVSHVGASYIDQVWTNMDESRLPCCTTFDEAAAYSDHNLV